MKNKCIIVVLILCFLIGGIGGYFIHPLLQKQTDAAIEKAVAAVTAEPEATAKTDESEDAELIRNGAIGRIDYPLIDLYFSHEKMYTLELSKWDGQKVKEYSAKGDFFQYNKGDFSIITCPSGMGTTPEYILAVYEGKKRIRVIDCAHVRSGMMDDKW